MKSFIMREIPSGGNLERRTRKTEQRDPERKFFKDSGRQEARKNQGNSTTETSEGAAAQSAAPPLTSLLPSAPALSSWPPV